MERNPLISVIVPVYNVENLLERCVDSILAQTYENLEVLLVDDGSKDSSGHICDAYGKKDSRVRVLHKENGGQSSARNMALDLAKGEYIAFVDSDDWIVADAYAAMLQQAQKHEVKLVCAGRYDVESETMAVTPGLCPARKEVLSAEEMLGRLFVWDNCDSAPWDKLYHRSVFDHIRFPALSGSEDVSVVYRLIEAAGQVAMLDKPVYYYFHRAGSTTTGKLSPVNFRFHEYTETIYPYIRDRYPAIAPKARYFRVRSLLYTVQSIDLADREGQKKYDAVYRQQLKNLRSHGLFILFSPLFAPRERAVDLLLLTGLYRPLRRLYHAKK